jgi:toxin ParE1/3/4
VSTKPVLPSDRASRDIEDILAHYEVKAEKVVAQDFIDELETAFGQLGRFPGSGSPRLGHVLGITRLRSWPVKRFPYLVLYIDRPDHVEVWRVLHSGRDVPGALQDEP